MQNKQLLWHVHLEGSLESGNQTWKDVPSAGNYCWEGASRRKFRFAKLVVILACPIQLPRSSPRSHTSMYNRKTPSSSGEHRAPTSALTHQLETTTTHVLSPRQAELLTTLGRIGGKDRDRDGEEQRREEGRFLYGKMGEGQKGQQWPDRAPGWDISD